MKPRLFMAADHVALPLLKAPWAAIQAAEAWLACPCEEHLDAWGGLIPVQGSGDPWWAAIYYAATWPDGDPAGAAIADAARLAGEAPVRAAITRDLTAWALS